MRKFSKLNTLQKLKSANTLKALLKNVLLYNLRTASARFLKHWLNLMRYSTFKISSFMFCQRFNRNFINDSCHSYFLIEIVTQNVNSDKFSNVNNEFNVRNVRT